MTEPAAVLPVSRAAAQDAVLQVAATQATLPATVLQPAGLMSVAKQMLQPARVLCRVAVLLVPLAVVRLPEAEERLA